MVLLSVTRTIDLLITNPWVQDDPLIYAVSPSFTSLYE